MTKNLTKDNENQKKPKLVYNNIDNISIFFCFVSFSLRIKRVNIELGELTQHNLKQLKILNRDIFPVSYNEKFYKDLLDAGELCKLGKFLKEKLNHLFIYFS